MESGWNQWVWLVSVVSRRQLWLVGGIYGCGYQEVGVVSGCCKEVQYIKKVLQQTEWNKILH